MSRKKIAIIGSGISGLSAAYFLQNKHNITIFEKNSKLGGHSRTITLPNGTNVDTGFIVLNDRTYPELNKFFAKLNIEIEKTEMSFSVSVNNGKLEWAGTSIDSMFAQRRNLLNLRMLYGLLNIVKFNRKAMAYVNANPDVTLGVLLNKMNLKTWVRDYYILPMGGAIWSCPYDSMLEFPASTFVNFFHNHGLLKITKRPQWYTVKNKSQDYVNTLEKQLKATIIKDAKITSITRESDKVSITANNTTHIFDEVIFSCNPTEILPLLKDVKPEEKTILSKFKTQKNTAYTHHDTKQMPVRKKCWSSWNYLCNNNSSKSTVSVTYWMNLLQHINKATPVFVTLNPTTPIAEDKIYDVYDFYHPVFDQDAVSAQKEIANIQGQNNTWFCGAYLRYGFHEDGIWSSIQMLKAMDENFAW